MEITILLYHRWHTSVNRGRNILKISQSAKWQTREEMQADHIVPWSKGGRTVAENCQMLCRRDNALKSDR